MGKWFGTCSAPGARMQLYGFLYRLLVAQPMWFGMLNVCSAKQERVEHSIEGHKMRDSNDVLGDFILGEAPIRHVKLPLAKCGSLLGDAEG